jgi:hypothetical protein
MRLIILRILAAFAWLAVLGQIASAVTLTITPSAISNTYSGLITLQVGGLTTGDTVVVQKFLDVNTNGAIDGSDWLVQQFNLTDGQAFIIGGITNYNVPGDLNLSAGAITAQLNFLQPSENGDVAQDFVGKYFYELSSPAGHFTPITNSFVVTNFPFGQSVSGVVRSNTLGMSNSVVIAFQASSSGDLNPQGAAVADLSGNYSLKLPVGTYQLVAFRSNYLANLNTAPAVTLTASATITTNLDLTNATQTISGKVADTNNQTVGLPGVLVPVTSTNNFIGVSFTDTNGNYTVGTRPSVWKVEGNGGSTTLHGYLSSQNKPQTNTASGSKSGVNILLPKATAMFYGSVKDNLNNPLPGVLLYSSDNNNQFEDDVATSANGSYNSGALPGNWSLSVDNNNPLYTNYVFSPGNNVNFTANQAVQFNFTAILGTNRITGSVKDSNNNPIAGVGVFATATINGTNYQTLDADADSNGNYTLIVPNGAWSVSAVCNGGDDSLDNLLGGGNYVCPDSQIVNIAGNNATNNISVQLCSGVSITTTSPLPSGQAGSPYDITLQAASCFPSFTWLQTAGSLPSGLTLETSGQLHGTPGTNGTFNFTAQVTDGSSHIASQPFALVIATNSLPPPPVNITPVNGQVLVYYPLSGSNYVLQTTTNLATGPWVPATNGVSVIALTFSNTAPVQFFRLH